MKLGIIGLPQSGKTTIFNALTRGNAPTTASAGDAAGAARWRGHAATFRGRAGAGRAG